MLSRSLIDLVDVTEHPIELPKKKQHRHYSGKKKRHTQKTQVILATAFAQGSQHGFALFKDSLCHLAQQICCVADTGYLGIHHLHENSQIPAKRSKLDPLTKEQKASNRKLSHERILVENIIRRLKIFRIL